MRPTGLTVKLDAPLPSFELAKEAKEHKFGTATIVMLGLGRMLVCHGFYWNQGLTIGAIPFLLNTLIWALGTICLSFCIAEMSSALPFTGGIYGFVRGIIGPYLGFFVGVFELCCGSLLITAYVVAFSICATSLFGLPLPYQIIFYPFPYLLSVFLQRAGRKRFASAVVGLTSLGLVAFAIYILGGFSQLNQARYGNHPDAEPDSVNDQIYKIFRNSSYAIFFFWGLETIPVISSEARQPNRSIPISVLSATAFSVFAAIAVLLIAAWQRPGPKTISQDYLPLNHGYANMFHISRDMANVFLLPATLAAVVTSVNFLSTIVRSMAKSGLLPSIFDHSLSDGRSTYVVLAAVIGGSIAVMFFNIIALIWHPRFVPIIVIMFQYCMYFNYLCIYASYLLFRHQHSAKEYTFHSPFGTYGAYLGIVITMMMFVLNVFPWYDYMGTSLCGFLLILAVATVSYLFYASRNQRFSPEEERVFFVAYIIRANRRHREAIKKAARSPMHRSIDLSGASNRSGSSNRSAPSSSVFAVKPKGSQRSFLRSLLSSMSTQSTSSRVHVTSKENEENDIEELSRSAASSLIAAADPSSNKTAGTLSTVKSSLYQQSSSSWRFRASPAGTENNSSSSRKYIPTDHGNNHHRSGPIGGANALHTCHSEGALSPHEDDVEEFPLLTPTAEKPTASEEEDVHSLTNGLQDIEDVESHEAQASMV